MIPSATSPGARPAIRPLGRRRPAEVRFDYADFAWIAIICICAMVCGAIVRSTVAAGNHDVHRIGHFSAIVLFGAIAGSVYVLGRILKDRNVAVAAGLLAATSLTTAAGLLVSPLSAVAALLLLLALIASARNYLFAAFAIAGLAACFRVDFLVAGIAIALGAVVLQRTNILRGFAVYSGSVLVAGALHVCFKLPVGLSWHSGLHADAVRITLRALGCTVLFAVPLITELADKDTRMRWLSTIASAGLLALAAMLSTRSPLMTVAPLLPLCGLLLAAGIARVMPAAVGDMPTPVTRYISAAAGLFLVLALRFAGE